jgi:hypothetical protein
VKNNLKRVHLKEDKELIRLCINNFNRYSLGKERFFHALGELYKSLSPNGNQLPERKGLHGSNDGWPILDNSCRSSKKNCKKASPSGRQIAAAKVTA